MDEAQASFERDVAARLRHLAKTARMWGSPEELETAATHYTHVWLASRGGWSFEQTLALWRALGAPFAGDADEHALMRSRMYADREAEARAQVVLGYASVWAELARHAERGPRVGPWIEALLDQPARAGPPDLLNIALFALLGFAAADAPQFVRQLGAVRERVGGHELRALHIVGQRGPSEAGLTYTRKFTTWDAVTRGLGAALDRVSLSLSKMGSGPG